MRKQPGRLDPFRRAVLRGLAVLLPLLLTIAIFLWAGSTVVRYLLQPLEGAVRYVLVEFAADIRPRDAFPAEQVSGGQVETHEGDFHRTEDGRFVPAAVYAEVEQRRDGAPMPPTARGVVTDYMEHRWLKRSVVIPIFTCLFVLGLYLLGKFLAAGFGRFMWSLFERLVGSIPVVRNVYASVKQVTDFVFQEAELEFTRVVAVEYPRRGIWSIAFVTGEGLLDIEGAANEGILSVLVPGSPMPFTGFTIMVKRSETIDLNLSVDQAIQYLVSCGVVVPPQQATEARRLRETAQRRLMASSVAEA